MKSTVRNFKISHNIIYIIAYSLFKSMIKSQYQQFQLQKELSKHNLLLWMHCICPFAEHVA